MSIATLDHPRPPSSLRTTAFSGAVWTERRSSRLPMDVLRLLVSKGLEPAMLSSADGYGEAGRYTLIALAARESFSVPQDGEENPFPALRQALARFPWQGGEERPPLPFFGGWVGYFSYELLHFIERIPRSVTVTHTFPHLELRFYPEVLAYDHRRQVWIASSLVPAEQAPDEAELVVKRLAGFLEEPLPPRDPAPALKGQLASNFTRTEYETSVGKVLAYIAAGDAYQVNLSQRFSGRLGVTPMELAARLSEVSPAPFGAFLQHGNRAIVSASPERFFRLRDRGVETCPVKGTRPRGDTPAEDGRLRRELWESAKECAELTMITDLLRNDLGRVCEYGSVEVVVARELQTFSNVHHACSKVRGKLRPGADIVALLRATLPGGSVTGAPKVRAMEIIEELEPSARGPYCGAIGYIGVDGGVDLNIAIRTILCEGEKLSFQVGGGIVADSDPAREYEETLHKARGILRALGVDKP